MPVHEVRIERESWLLGLALPFSLEALTVFNNRLEGGLYIGILTVWKP